MNAVFDQNSCSMELIGLRRREQFGLGCLLSVWFRGSQPSGEAREQGSGNEFAP